jgi:hypothetical protein
MAPTTCVVVAKTVSEMCEDYPCCGHAMGMCNEESKGEGFYHNLFANPNYDPYYDEGDR